MSASALAVYVNSLFLIPKFARCHLWWQYTNSLLATVAVLDLIAVLLIQFMYDWLWGPDPRRFGFWFNMLSDGIIIVVHIVAATIMMMWVARLLHKRMLRPAKQGLSESAAEQALALDRE
jgi:NADH:ubiquinone oxidoreductase subunit 3 (subunit A)